MSFWWCQLVFWLWMNEILLIFHGKLTRNWTSVFKFFFDYSSWQHKYFKYQPFLFVKFFSIVFNLSFPFVFGLSNTLFNDDNRVMHRSWFKLKCYMKGFPQLCLISFEELFTSEWRALLVLLTKCHCSSFLIERLRWRGLRNGLFVVVILGKLFCASTVDRIFPWNFQKCTGFFRTPNRWTGLHFETNWSFL